MFVLFNGGYVVNVKPEFEVPTEVLLSQLAVTEEKESCTGCKNYFNCSEYCGGEFRVG